MGSGRTIEFDSVTGQVCAGTNWPQVGPDGGTTMMFGARPTNIVSASGISGMLHPNFEFLAGVFLDDSAPITGAEPTRLDFNSIGANFTDLNPLLAQTFPIGDGLTGTGSGQHQIFHVPDNATRLFLGFLDAYDFGGPSGRAPSQYADDTGSFTARYTVTAVPEPGGIGLLLAGASLLALWRWRRGSR
jgi:hypothetical protein